MVRGDIVGGIKVALSRGEKLQDVMQSFYNSGYEKGEIEEAARIVHGEGFQPRVIKKQVVKTTGEKAEKHPEYTSPPKVLMPQPAKVIESSIKKTPTEISPPQAPAIERPSTMPTMIEQKPLVQQQRQYPVQVVSNYGQPIEKKGIDTVTILLIVILLALLGVLGAVFWFKQDIVEFLTKILD